MNFIKHKQIAFAKQREKAQQEVQPEQINVQQVNRHLNEIRQQLGKRA